MRASGAGIKMEGLLYLQKYGIGGPEFGITERRISNRKRKAALPCPCMDREACQVGRSSATDQHWNHPLASGFTRERRLVLLLLSFKLRALSQHVDYSGAYNWGCSL